ncbi:matrix metalloproteinase-16-like [Anneissia japonica]|uniref:matrix metalloproteinase-16-like n=1 Tax=Anneissia japonica TaxID=1529436 RepID=UPI0014256FBF|nr:matrix metalloproteinase-16-like [Anneissia japonica]
MVQYGYMNPTADGRKHNDEEMRNGLMSFQRFNGMNDTGSMDNATMHKMHTPRCGVKDILYTPSSVRARRYAFAGSRWPSTSLTYRYINYSPDLTEAQTRQAIEAAFKVWSDVTPLIFTEEKGSSVPDIYILFQPGEHGDGNAFDGPSGTLAHAYFPAPGIGGDAHFDESEFFTINGERGIDLFQVAAHEFGHSMGLAHSSDPNALMAPFYAGYIANFVLPQDDINGIQALYGPNRDIPAPTAPPVNPVTSAPPPVTAIPNPTIEPSLCSMNYDAISFLRTEIFMFNDEDILRIAMRGSLVPGYPRKISDFFSTLEDNIDASYERYDGTIMFFKGDRYWEFNGNNVLPGFPTSIFNLGDLPIDLDAALNWGDTGYTYFFKGSQYWRYNEPSGRVDDNYPRSIAAGWPGVPDDLDAAFRWLDGNTYFVKGTRYWQFDVSLNQVNETIYPRNFGEDWLGCASGNPASLTSYSIHIVIVAFTLAKLLRL